MPVPDFSRVQGGSSTTAPAKRGAVDSIKRALGQLDATVAKPLNAINDWLARQAQTMRQDTGLEHGVTGVGAKVLGVPRWLLIAGLAGVAYMAAQSFFPRRR